MLNFTLRPVYDYIYIEGMTFESRNRVCCRSDLYFVRYLWLMLTYTVYLHRFNPSISLVVCL